MREAVIVSTARTGLAKSWRGALNMTHGADMAGHVVKAAVERAMKKYEKQTGDAFWKPAAILSKLAAEGKNFN